jgi:hypothetical protein
MIMETLGQLSMREASNTSSLRRMFNDHPRDHYICKLSKHVTSLFDQPLHSVVATTTNVAMNLQKDIDASVVSKVIDKYR